MAFTPYGRSAGSSRVRVFEWLDHLNLEAEVHVFTEQSRAGARQMAKEPQAELRLRRLLRRIDVQQVDAVLIHRELGPLTSGKEECAILEKSKRGIVDLDDGLMWDWGEGGLARRLSPKARKVARMVAAAHTVIAGNDLIADWASQFCDSVVVIPSCIEPMDYVQKANYHLSTPAPLIGWVGSIATEQHLLSARTTLEGLHKEFGVQLLVIGDDRPKLGSLEQMICRVAWTKERQQRLIATFDAGIMPVPDGIMERSKCAYKLLQYGAAGVPVAGSAIGANAKLLGQTLAESDLADTLRNLICSTSLERQQLANSLHRVVSEHFSFAANSQRWLRSVFSTVS